MSPSLLSRRLPLAAAETQHRVLGRLHLACEFDEAVERAWHGPLTAGMVEIFQINVGKLCNQTCRHCHRATSTDRQRGEGVYRITAAGRRVASGEAARLRRLVSVARAHRLLTSV